MGAEGGENPMGETTEGKNLNKSGESSRTEIVVGKGEGLAFGVALEYLTKMEATDSGETQAGDYIIAYSIEEAEGLYWKENGKLVWHDPVEENCHLEIVVRNASDGRFLPSLTVQATLAEFHGNIIGRYDMPFLWHPWVYHYGRNCKVPQSGNYKLTVRVESPDFPRHDRINGKRFMEPVTVDFEINIKTGRKISKAA